MKAYNGTIMVTGASGHLGQLVLDELLSKYKGKVIAGSRHVEKLQKFKNQGAEVRKVDFNQPEELEQSFENVDKLFIISTDSLAVPGERLRQHLAAVKAAKAAGVKHIVYTSLNNPDKVKIFFGPDHKGSEDAILASGLEYTILRNNWYMQNLDAGLKHALESGSLVTSTGAGKVGFISREDCAAVAVAALMNGDFQHSILDVTNEETVSYPEIAQMLKIKFIDVSKAEIEKAYAGMGLPPFVVDLFATYEESVKEQQLNIKNNIVRELTGKAPTTLQDYLKALK
ncbi:SDR family oxidoreductase [Peredibacter starrii]|uniref:SDR family oxidoreductase n=1 Tax=Peredibacter starrii TaxID=28202 RepID=A0AAX4HU54_9BACT|nr:SDR family oxidoreductase [Peredibacter starrii]WPU66812.1 SDR family oxidoreductase [Peredibacter starrii]